MGGGNGKQLDYDELEVRGYRTQLPSHSVSPGDDIDQHAQERHDDQEDEPDGLPPTAEILFPEEIDKNLE